MSDLNRTILVDWGTSNFRAFLVDAEGNELDQMAYEMGLLQVEKREFEKALVSMLSEWREDFRDYPVLMGGMIGSRNGWVEVPYVETPACLSEIAQKTYSFMLPWGQNVTIIPGVKHFYKSGNMSVMRGEEVQAIGLLNLVEQKSSIALFPGTHSKHIALNDSQILSVDTFMTGELYSLVAKGSILSTQLPQQEESESAFVKGIHEGKGYSLNQSLFFARTHRLANSIAEKHIMSYISGLIIGDELSSVARNSDVYIVGGDKLTSLYLLACREMNIKAAAICGNKAFMLGAITIKGLLNV
ncbi:2-dehydro-3-deoxygalactonokinase [Vibrio mediterranei]